MNEFGIGNTNFVFHQHNLKIEIDSKNNNEQQKYSTPHSNLFLIYLFHWILFERTEAPITRAWHVLHAAGINSELI